MHTKDILAEELRKAGLPLMAKRAAEGVYSNGLSLHALPETVLRRDLLDAHSPLADALLCRVDAGEFDATDEEIDQGNARIVTGRMIAALAQQPTTSLEFSRSHKPDSELKATDDAPSQIL